MKQIIDFKTESKIVDAIYSENLLNLILFEIERELSDLNFYIEKYGNSYEHDLSLVKEKIEFLNNKLQKIGNYFLD